MDITEINMITDFQVGMKSLQNPTFVTRFFSIPGIQVVSQVYSFWKWGALIFAIYATFGSLVKRIKLVLIRFAVKSSANLEAEIVDFSDGEEVSTASSDDDEQDAEESGGARSLRCHHRRDDGDFRVKGSRLLFKSQGQNGHMRRRRRRSNGSAWSEFAPGKSVVKIWDCLGLNLDFDEDLFNYGRKSVVSTWESDRDQMTTGFSAGLWDSPAAAPIEYSNMYLTAERNRSGEGVILGGYDTRMRHRTPALYAEWSSTSANVASISASGSGRVYVRDDASTAVVVGDVRNVRRPLGSVTESKGSTGRILAPLF